MSFVIIFIASSIGVAALTGLAAWARIERPLAPLDRKSALALFDDEFPEHRIESLWIAADGAGAIAKSDSGALIAFRTGDAYVARSAPWRAVEAAGRDGRKVRLALGDIAAPRATFTIPDQAPWPPRLDAVA